CPLPGWEALPLGYSRQPVVDPLFLVARNLPVRHGFPLRRGGVSDGKRASLDLGPAGDVGADVRENRLRLARAAGLAPDALILAEQVHGTRVLRARPGGLPRPAPRGPDAPGAWAATRPPAAAPPRPAAA